MSAQTYKIVSVADRQREWDSKYGAMVSYYVQVHGDERTFELAQKKDTAPPSVGQELLATVEEREFNGTTFFKLKRVQPQGGGAPRPEDPERQRRIVRQHSQEMALRYCAVKGAIPEDRSVLTQLIDWFEKDVG